MSRRSEEQAVIESFALYLKSTTGRTWTASDDEVPNPTNGRKYDCEFTSDGCLPVAADVFRLFPAGSEQALQGSRNRLISRLIDELRKEGVGGLFIETPFPEKKHVRPEWYKNVARQFRELIAHDPNAEVYEVDGLYARRCGAPDAPNFLGHHWMNGYQPIEAAGYPLAAILRDKNKQLAVDGHARYLIGTMRGMAVRVEDVTASCAFIDFTKFPNIDRIYFEAAGDDFRLVYDRAARESMERGELPTTAEQRRLVVDWIEVLMGFHWPRGLELALQIKWDQGGTEWLSPGGRVVLELESHLLLQPQNCEWSTPRAYWEIHRGRIPVIGDGRRRVQPILAPAV
jgi:hypothetical protein